ncbi:MAG: DUF4129 domain-containing protein [Solirubrobacteraceae bacterium]
MRRCGALVACALACAAWPVAAHGAEATAAELRSRARAQAREILAERRFQPTPVPAPLRSVRERIGKLLRSLGRPFEAAFRWAAGWIPGGGPVLWGLLAVAALVAGALIARELAHRARSAPAGAATAGGKEHPSAAHLRRQAERAERRGELDLALRLRFRAGLLDLDDRKLIVLRPALTHRELLRVLPSPTLAELVVDFEAVAYGGRPAAENDLHSAREGWPRVADEARSR